MYYKSSIYFATYNCHCILLLLFFFDNAEGNNLYLIISSIYDIRLWKISKCWIISLHDSCNLSFLLWHAQCRMECHMKNLL